MKLSINSPYTNTMAALLDMLSIIADGYRVNKGRLPLKAIESDVYFTRDCNLQCSYCYVEKAFPDINAYTAKSVPTDKLKIILKAVKQYTYGLVILGGEPFCRHDIVDILQYAKSELKFTSIRISTNGTLAGNYVEGLKFVDKLAISFDPTRIREYPSITKTMLSRLLELREKKLLPPTHMNLTFTNEDSPKDFDKILHFCNKNNFKIHLAPCKYQKPPAYLRWREMYEYVARSVGENKIITNKKVVYNSYNLSNFIQNVCLQRIQYYIDIEGNMMYPCDEYAHQFCGNICDNTLHDLFDIGLKRYGEYPVDGGMCSLCESECHTNNSLLYHSSIFHATLLLYQLFACKLRSLFTNEGYFHKS